MMSVLVRALAERAEQVATWEHGIKPEMVQPRLASGRADAVMGNETVEFRVKVFGPSRLTYVVTISEVAE
jgi:hypothetical protein